jgi:PAS domain S-box-containing protein
MNDLHASSQQSTRFSRPGKLQLLRVWLVIWGRVLAWGVLVGTGAVGAPAKTPEVFILCSYSTGYDWSDEVLGGVMNQLKAFDPSIDPIIQHLDFRRFPNSEREEWIARDIEYKIRERRPQLLIVLDDPAFTFARTNRQRLWPSIPMVFGGVNRFTPELIAGMPDVTGVSEESDFHRTFELIRCLKPETKRILVVSTQTPSGLNSRLAMEQIARRYEGIYQFEYFDNWTDQQLIDRVSSLPEGTVGFLIEATQDINGRYNYTDAEFSRSLSSKASQPLFLKSRPPGKHDWSVDPWDGIGGGLVVASLHGDKVGELAVRVLKGERAADIPVELLTPERIEVDYRHLQRFGLTGRPLPPGTVVVNAPVTFYQVHRSKIILVGIAFVILCIVITALFLNILRRHRVEQALKRAQADLELLARAIAQASDMILVLGTDGVVKYANPAFGRIMRCDPGQAKGRHLDSLWDDTTDKPAFARNAPVAEREGLWSGVFHVKAQPNHQVRLEAMISPMRDSQGVTENYLFMARDTTLESKLEEQLRSSQKMEAIGSLAGGIAHDFNNILQVINGFTASMLEECGDHSPLKEDLQMVREAGNRAAQLTRQLLLFSRKQALNVQEVDPSEMVADLLKMVRRLIGEHIEIRLQPLKAPCRLMLDKGQMEQVLLNLCLNARDAMPEGGRIVIDLQRTRVESDDLQNWPELQPGDHLMLSVGDTGCGMRPEVVSRLFEPFFTTKPVGKGTGLGLSVVYGIIKQHHGAIRVYSEPGHGSEFKIYLPFNTAGNGAGSVGNEKAAVVSQGSGTILIAEDDPQVRLLARKILERNGFKILLAHDGEEALKLIDTHHSEIRLAMLDAMMPRLGGRAVYEEIRRRRLDLPVLFCSGYSAELLPEAMAPESGVALLNKPYRQEDLLQAIHRLLEKRA